MSLFSKNNKIFFELIENALKLKNAIFKALLSPLSPANLGLFL